MTESNSYNIIGTLIFDETLIIVPAEYFNYNNIFLEKNVAKLLKHTRINHHAIKLEKNKQPLFELFYSLGPIELKTLKTYIKIILANSFVWFFKIPAEAFILIDLKSDGNF